MGSSKKQTVGYRYFMGLHFGLCYGPVDALLEIRGGDRTAWAGLASASGPIEINAPNLFGGEKKEGGIVGTLDVMMGEPTQAPNDYLASQISGPIPAFRGLLSLVFRKGMVGCMNPYPKPWKFRVRRILAGWSGDAGAWYPGRAEIDLGGAKAMNPAHIVYEALTNPEWGMGYPAGALDAASFTAAADVFHAEGMGLCMQWVSSDSIEGFVQEVMNHAGGVLAQDPRTGLFQMLPIRGGYVVADLPEFRRGLNVIAVENFERAAITETVNELTVIYTDVSSGKDVPVTVQQLANIQAQGGVVPQTVRYKGIPTGALAQRVALRDLAARSQPLCKVRLIVDRSAYGVLPGKVLRWSDDKLGIIDMPMRVLQVNYGTLTAGAITLDLAEDVFGLPATTYAGQQPPGWVEPPVEPQPSPAVDAFEAPYVALRRDQGSVVDSLADDAGFLAMVAARPAGVNFGFEVHTRVGSAGYQEGGAGDWTAGGPLLYTIAATSAPTLLTLDPPRGLGQVEVGDLAMLGTGDLAELVRVDNVNVAGGTVTVARGVADTTPRAWPVATRLWVIDSGAAVDVTEYAAGETVDAKAVTQGSGGPLDLNLAPGDSVVMSWRQFRPYPPARLHIATPYAPAEPYPPEAYGAITATWVHRDRLAQGDQLVDQEAGGIGPEAGTTYTARWYIDGLLAHTESGIAGNSATYEPPGGSGGKVVRVEVSAVRDALESWQAATHSMLYTGQRITEAGAVRITEAGDRRVME